MNKNRHVTLIEMHGVCMGIQDIELFVFSLPLSLSKIPFQFFARFRLCIFFGIILFFALIVFARLWLLLLQSQTVNRIAMNAAENGQRQLTKVIFININRDIRID